MGALPPFHLPPDEKLSFLRQLDEFRFWHSLDDQRVCQVCGRTISGRQIDVIARTGPGRTLALRCPTPNCPAQPGDWLYRDPMAAAMGMRDFAPEEMIFPPGAHEIPTRPPPQLSVFQPNESTMAVRRVSSS